MSRLKVSRAVKDGEYQVTLGEHSARIVGHVCNGRAVYGFGEPKPDPVVEAALAKKNDFKLGALIKEAQP